MLRNKTIELESVLYPLIQDIEDKIVKQNELIETYKNNFSKLSKENELMLKIYAKQQKISGVLSEFSKSKEKEVYKLRNAERQQKYRQYLVDTDENSLNHDVRQEYYMTHHRRTPTFQTTKIIDNSFFKTAVQSLKKLTSFSEDSEELTNLLEKIRK